MKRTSIYLWNIAGFLFTTVVGSLLHFVNDWFSGPIWRIIGATNESTWEHLKLIFFPMLAFGILEYFFYGKKICGFFSIKVCSILLGMITTVVLFYTYTGILGFHIAALDISIFVFSVLFAYCFACRRILRQFPGRRRILLCRQKAGWFFLSSGRNRSVRCAADSFSFRVCDLHFQCPGYRTVY